MRSTKATLPRARPVRVWRLSRTTVSSSSSPERNRRQPPVPSLRNVVRISGCDNSCQEGHDFTL